MELHGSAYNLLFDFEKRVTQLIHENLQRGYGKKEVSKIARGETDRFGLPTIFYLSDKICVLRAQYDAIGGRKKRACQQICSGFMWLKINEKRNAISHAGIEDPITHAEYQSLIEYLSTPEFLEFGLDFGPLIREQASEGFQLCSARDDVDYRQVVISDADERHSTVIPNNLENIEIERIKTSFVGRQVDCSKLEQSLFSSNFPRLVVTAPGGVGKTALAIEVLKKISRSKIHSEMLDAIVLLPLKQEYLCWDGIKKKNRDISLEAIKENLHSQICKVLNLPVEGDILDLEDHRVLVCIDNLENVLLRSPEAFVNFFDECLPQNWRYLMTSRIPVDGFRTHNLEYMSASDGSVLCQEFFDLKSYRFASEEARRITVDNIVAASMGIPLAIKYSVDSIVHGGREVPNAIQRTREQILAFSFDTFIHSLGGETVEARFVAALYALEQPSTRIQICQIGEIEDETEFFRASQRLNWLNVASRDDLTNVYMLAGPVRELMTTKGYLSELITSCRDRLASIRIAAQRAHAVPQLTPFSFGYISEAASDEVRHWVAGVADALATKDPLAARETWDRLNSRKSVFEGSSDFQYFFGLASYRLSHYSFAKQCFENAIRLDENHNIARLMLAKTLRKMHDIPQALQSLQALFDLGYGDPTKSSDFFAEQLIRTLVRSFVYQGQYDQALNLTSGWKEAGSLKRVCAVGRVFSLTRFSEGAVLRDDVSTFTSLIQEASDILSCVLREMPGESDVESASQKLVERITSTLNTRAHFVTPALVHCLASFLEEFEARLSLKLEAKRFILRLIDELDHSVVLDLTIVNEFSDYFFGSDSNHDYCFISKSLKCAADLQRRPVKGSKVIVRAVERENTACRYRAYSLLNILS